MADEVEISNVGGPQGVASEATLAALVKALNTGSNGAAKAIRLESIAREAFTKKISGETGLVGKAFGSVVNAAGGFIDQLFNGSGRLSDFTDAVLGTNNILTKSFSVFAHFVDNNVDSLRELSAVGANFNNSIFDMRTAASSAALTFEQFTDLVKNNSELFAKLGGSVSNGAKMFGDFSKSVRTSKVGKELMGMGFTINSINEGLTSYLDIQLQSGRAINLRDKNLIKSSEEYLFQLDQLARLTGKQRDEIADEMVKLQQSNAIRQQLENLDAEGKKNLSESLVVMRELLPSFSSGMEDIMDGIAQTPLGKVLEQQIEGLGPLMRKQFAGEISGADFLVEIQKLGPQFKALQEKFKDPEFITALEQSGSDYARALAEAVNNSNEFNRILSMDIEAFLKEQGQRQSLTELFGSFEQTLIDVRTALTNAFLTSGTFEALKAFGDDLLKMVNPDGGLTQFKVVLEKMVTQLFSEDGMLTRAVKSLHGAFLGFIGDMDDGKTFSESVSNMMSRLGNDIAYGWNEFWTGPIGTKISDTITSWWDSLMLKFLETLNHYFGMFIDDEDLIKKELKVFQNEVRGADTESQRNQMIFDKIAELQMKRSSYENTFWFNPEEVDVIDQQIEDLKRLLDKPFETVAPVRPPEQLTTQPADTRPTFIGGRAIGTLRTTGYTFEPEDTVAKLHQGERVLNPQETQMYNNLNSIQSQLIKKVEELNTSMLKAVDLLEDSVNVARLTSRSIKSLGTDAMRGVGR